MGLHSNLKHLINGFFEQPYGLAFGNESQLILTNDFTEVSIEEIEAFWHAQHKPLQHFIGFLPYQETSQAKFKIFKINSGVILEDKEFISIGDGKTTIHKSTTTMAQSSLRLTPYHSKDHYVQTVQHIQEDILSGKYYQLNYLEYFRCNRDLSTEDMIALYQKHQPKMFSYYKNKDFELFSLSPERFIQIRDGQIHAFPIKGTKPRSTNTQIDEDYKNELFNSPKDRAELAMIVDLMRNDFFKICKPQSVKVGDFPQIQTFANVHHLIGEVLGLLKENVSLSQIIQSLHPAGSITGAPKEAVMKAIEQYESENIRHYFMGNAIYLRSDGYLDSSVLIRTFQKIPGSLLQGWHYAAGSGITARSQAEVEYQEVLAKANILEF